MCSRGRQASLVTAITQDTLVKTQSLFRICVVVLSSITSRSVAAAAASSLMRFSPSPSCRGDAANPWLESAFITHVGCLSRHLFVCSQSIAIACVSCRVSPLLVCPSEYRHCLCFFCWFSQSTTIACVSVFSASGTARARSFSTHERSRTTESTVSEHIDHKDRQQLQLFQRLALRRGRASFCNICQHTSSQPPIAGLFVTPWNKDDMGDGVPTDQLSHNHCDCTDSHCNSHIVTSCVFVLVLHSHHKSIGGRLLLLPRAARDGIALCHLSRQDTSRGVPSQGRHWSKVCACRR